MNITVNIDEITLASVVDQTYRQTGEEDWTAEGVTIGEIVATKIVEKLTSDTDRWDDLRSRVTAIRDEEIRAAIAPKVAEAIDTPIQRTNEYGRAVGEPTTLTELIVKAASDYCNKPVDNYNRGGGTVLQKHVTDAVQAAFQREIADQVKQVRAAVGAKLGATVSTEIQKALEAGLRGF